MALDANTVNEVIDFITPFVSDTGSRNVLVTRTFLGESVVSDIDTSGPASAFAEHIVTVLNNYDGVNAIIRMLETLKERVGPSRQAEIDALVALLKG